MLSDRSTIPGLTSIRFFAASWVALFHYNSMICGLFPGFAAIFPLISRGFLGVDLFFVLSGFILTYNYRDFLLKASWRNYCRFWSLRLARIYPVHVFTILLVGAVLLVARTRGISFSPEGYSWQNLVRNLLLVHAWFSDAHSWNGPAWSISSEWLAYLVLPFIMPWVTRFQKTWQLVGLSLVSIAWMCALWPLNEALGKPVSDATIRVLGEFLVGCLMGQHVLTHPRSSPGARALPLLMVAVGVCGTVVYLGTAFEICSIVVLFAGSILFLARAEVSWLAWMKLPWLVYLGEASYALYMTHAILETVILKSFPLDRLHVAPWPARAAFLVGLAAVLLGVAILTYRVVEVPSRARLRALINRMF